MDKYAVIGNPVEHSLSPIIHRLFAEQTHRQFLYEKIKAPVDQFIITVKQFQQNGGKGLNVTLPFKQEAYQFASKKSAAAKEAEAASVLHFLEPDIIYADNFDGWGLVQDLTINYHVTLTNKKILIVGAGGAAQGILGPLLKKNPAMVIIANRTPKKAQQLAAKFQRVGKVFGLGCQELPSEAVDIIIHATSLGHQGEVPALPPDLITADTYCYDISYAKAAQPFLNCAKKQGAKKCFDGLGMLVEHNAAVFNLWFGIYPKTQPVIQYLRQQFSKNDHIM